MPSLQRGYLWVCAAALAACAASPRVHDAAVAERSAPQSRSPGAQVGSASADGALDALLVRDGYRIIRHGDEVRYCRTVTPTGTAFSSTVCLTAQQVEEQRRSLQQSQQDLTLTRGITCAGKLCVGGN